MLVEKAISIHLFATIVVSSFCPGSCTPVVVDVRMMKHSSVSGPVSTSLGGDSYQMLIKQENANYVIDNQRNQSARQDPPAILGYASSERVTTILKSDSVNYPHYVSNGVEWSDSSHMTKADALVATRTDPSQTLPRKIIESTSLSPHINGTTNSMSNIDNLLNQQDTSTLASSISSALISASSISSTHITNTTEYATINYNGLIGVNATDPMAITAESRTFGLPTEIQVDYITIEAWKITS